MIGWIRRAHNRRYRRRIVTTQEHQRITTLISELLQRDPVTLRAAPPGEGFWNVVSERQDALYRILGMDVEGWKARNQPPPGERTDAGVTLQPGESVRVFIPFRTTEDEEE